MGSGYAYDLIKFALIRQELSASADIGTLPICEAQTRLTHEVTNVRTDSGIPEAYPDFAEKIAHAVQRSILIYGSGVEARPALALAI